MPFWKNILVWIMTGLIAIAAFFCNIFGIEPPTMPDCLTTTTAVVTTVKDPWVRTTTLTEVETLGLRLYEDVAIDAYNSVGTYRPYEIDAYRLIDVLRALGADVDAITSSSVLLVQDTSATPPYEATITGSLITSDESYLAVYVLDKRPGQTNPNPTGSAPRLFPAPSLTNPTDPATGTVVATGTFVNTALCCSNINKITLTY